MNDCAFDYQGGLIGVDWSSLVTGIHTVKQKLVNNLLTDIGTDEVNPSRGTSLLRTVVGGGVFDGRSAQHALNFAALAAKRTVRAGESDDATPADKVIEFTAVLDTVDSGALITSLALTTADGNSIGTLQQIA